MKVLKIFFWLLFLVQPIHAQNQNKEIIEKIKQNGPGDHFVISQIQSIKGHNWGGYKPIIFSGSSFSGDLSWVDNGMIVGGNSTVMRFTNKVSFSKDTVYFERDPIFLPQNIKGFTFESQVGDTMTFILLEKYGLVYVSGRGIITFPDGKKVKVSAEDVASSIISDTSESIKTIQLKSGSQAERLFNALDAKDFKNALILVQNVDSVNYRSNKGVSLLYLSSYNGYLDVCKTLLDKGAKLDLLANGGISALMIASYNGHAGVVKLLLDKGAKLDLQANDGGTALYVASQNGYIEVVKLLLGKGAKLDLLTNGSTANGGMSALMIASKKGHTEVVKLLLDKGATLDLQGKYGETALMNASRAGHAEVVKLLLDRGAKLDLMEFKEITAINLAAEYGHTEVVKLLLDSGAKLDLQPNKHWTPLMNASQAGRAEVVKLLLDRGAKLDLQSTDGMTALILAAYNGHTEVVKLLLDKGANLDLKDNEGKTAFDNSRNADIKTLLSNHIKK